MPLSSAKIVREILYVPPSMPALDLLAKMQATRIHLALIIDEYGGTDGLVSMEDMVELIVGDIADEHDEAEMPAMMRQSDGSYLANGRASLGEVRAALGDEFDIGEAAQEVDTLGGYLVMKAGHVPVRGELVRGPDPFESEVLDADPRRVKRVRIYRRKELRGGTGARAARARQSRRHARRCRVTMDQSGQARTARREAESVVQCHRAVVGLAALPDRVRCRRAFGAGDGAVQCLADFVSDVSGAGLADRRFRRQPLGRRRSGGMDRLVVRFRLFRRRALLDRLRVSGRRADLRLDAAVRGAGPAGGVAPFTRRVGVAMARLLWTRGAMRILALAVALTATEYLRGHLFTGFPWNAFGYAIAAPLPLAQSASLVGLWGMTFIVIAIFATPATLADDPADTPRPLMPLLIGIAALIGLAGYGASRLHRNPTRLVDKVHLRIMQPNLQQDVRFNYAARQQVMNRYVALSDQAAGPDAPGMKDVTHLIWPESPFPFFLTREPDALAQITQLLPQGADADHRRGARRRAV